MLWKTQNYMTFYKTVFPILRIRMKTLSFLAHPKANTNELKLRIENQRQGNCTGFRQYIRSIWLSVREISSWLIKIYKDTRFTCRICISFSKFRELNIPLYLLLIHSIREGTNGLPFCWFSEFYWSFMSTISKIKTHFYFFRYHLIRNCSFILKRYEGSCYQMFPKLLRNSCSEKIRKMYQFLRTLYSL